ncbi:hypothetical protein GCM10027592_31620 [Spirosoma flavus]
MYCGLETINAVLDEKSLIQKLDVNAPVSMTHGNWREDLPLISSNYKGMHIQGTPRSQRGLDGEFFWFNVRGSINKLANGGRHNADSKDPFEILFALDDLVTNLRINPFLTQLNGLELSATVPTCQAEKICTNIVSYLNNPPALRSIRRFSQKLPYAEVIGGQHKLKVYGPIKGALRVEIKADKMQYLGSQAPQTFADLVEPKYVPMLATKLLAAFDKIIWKYQAIDLPNLSADEYDLYLKGRCYDYWQVKRSAYTNQAEFKRAEYQKDREKGEFKELVQRHWLSESPRDIQQRIADQLDYYQELMHTLLYQTLLEICLERWHYIESLPNTIRLPSRLKLLQISEIYRLYRYKDTTRFFFTSPPSVNKLMEKSQPILELFADPIRTPKIHQEQIIPNKEYRRTPSKLLLVNNLRRVKKELNVAGGLNYFLADLQTLLPVKTRLALTHNGKSLTDLIYSGSNLRLSLPLFVE